MVGNLIMAPAFDKNRYYTMPLPSKTAMQIKQWRQTDTVFWLNKALRCGCWWVWDIGVC